MAAVRKKATASSCRLWFQRQKIYDSDESRNLTANGRQRIITDCLDCHRRACRNLRRSGVLREKYCKWKAWKGSKIAALSARFYIHKLIRDLSAWAVKGGACHPGREGMYCPVQAGKKILSATFDFKSREYKSLFCGVMWPFIRRKQHLSAAFFCVIAFIVDRANFTVQVCC